MFHKYESHESDLLGLSQSWISCFFLIRALLYRNLYKILPFPRSSLFLCYTLLDPVRANHLLSELKEPTHLSCPSCSVLCLIRKINQGRISFFEALQGMAVREVQKKPWAMSPGTLFHIELLLLTQHWFILLNRVFLLVLHLPFHQQLHLEALWTACTLMLHWVSLTPWLVTWKKSFNFTCAEHKNN